MGVLIMISPHGGELIERVMPDSKREKILAEINDFYQFKITSEQYQDVENIAYGVFSPITGFLMKDEYEFVLKNSRLSDDNYWTIPILLDIPDKDAESINPGASVILIGPNGPNAIMEIQDKYKIDKKTHSQSIYGTLDATHPGVKRTANLNEIAIGGPIELIQPNKNQFDDYYLKPMETRKLFQDKDWKRIVAFQTRNPPHVGHEYVQKTALSMADGILINPIIGKKKAGDFKDEVILSSYKALIENYFPNDQVVLSILKTEMHYAGPKEAIHHAIIRQNFGCTHFIVGRDHAGYADFYGPYDAHEIFKEFLDLEIEPLFFKSISHCNICDGPVDDEFCPHPVEDHVSYQSTMIREIVSSGRLPPKELVRPEVVEVIKGYKEPFIE